MARESYIFDPVTMKLVPKGEYQRSKPAPARSDLPSPLIASDSMPPGQSQLDGKIYDSRSALMRSYRDYEARTGKEVTVVGDQVHHLKPDTPAPPDEKAIDRAIKHALEKHDA